MTDDKRASESLMDELHGLTAEAYLAEIRRLKAAGEGIPPALLTAAAKFLKDNGVDRPIRVADKSDPLAAILPEISEIMNLSDLAH